MSTISGRLAKLAWCSYFALGVIVGCGDGEEPADELQWNEAGVQLLDASAADGATPSGGDSGAASDGTVARADGESALEDASAAPGEAGATPQDGGGSEAGVPVGEASGPSAGCGKSGAPQSGMYNMDVGGTQRMYILKLPAGYDANKQYKLIFTWHYLGGSASGIARSYYGLEAMSAGSSIFVSPEGINAGWGNSGGQDVAFAKAMVAKFKGDYCIDQARVFSVGFSYGAIMSNTVGCAMGDVFRAIAPMAGSGPRGRCTGQVAAWLFHGSADGTVSFSSGQASRDFWRTANHCGMETEPPDANGCIAYKGCDPGYPVIWCQTTAGHTQPRFGPDAIWKFFSSF